MNTPAKRGEHPTPATIEDVLIRGNLADLTPQQRVEYVARVCASLGLNPLTRPFEYLMLSGRLVLYAKRDAADQLRKINGIVHARAKDHDGRTDEDLGVVPYKGGGNEFAANAMMKAVTKAKRRVTLSISGLGFLDETEVGQNRERPQTISKEQRETIRKKADESETELTGFLDLLSERWEVEIAKVADIPAELYDDAIALLDRKREAYEAAKTNPVTGEVVDAG
jgi:hypothetical protein